MKDCERLSDRMPDVALRRAQWTSEEAAHLAGCSACLAEWRLVLAARALDQGAPTISDPATLSVALQRRLTEDRLRRSAARRVWSFAGVAAAAAAILVAVMTGRDARTVPASQVAVQAEAMVPLPELEGLESAQLDTLLQSLDRPSTGASTLDASTLGEHEDGELELVFATLEG